MKFQSCLVAGALASVFAAPGVASSATCESLSTLQLPNTTITMAQTVAAGSFVAPARGGPSAGSGQAAGQPLTDLPAFCRVQATLRPSIDSDIRMELWLPASAESFGGQARGDLSTVAAGGGGWNGKLKGTGNGGLGGGTAVGAGALANGVRRGYA